MRATKQPPTQFARVVHANPSRLPRSRILITSNVPNVGPQPHLTSVSGTIQVDNVILIMTIFHVIVPRRVRDVKVLHLIQRRSAYRDSNRKAKDIRNACADDRTLNSSSSARNVKDVQLVTPRRQLISFDSVGGKVQVEIIQVVRFVTSAPRRSTNVITITACRVNRIPFCPLLRRIRDAIVVQDARVPTLCPFTF